MYPLKTTLLGLSDNETSELRRLLENIPAEIVTVGKVSDLPRLANLGTESARAFLIRVKNSDDLEVLRRLNRTLPGSPILALMNGDSDVAAVLHTLRAGAAQVVFFPLQPADLRSALETLALQFGYDSGIGGVVAIAGVTEGCGATSLGINLAYDVATIRKRDCILAEIPVHIGRLALALDIEPKLSIHDLLAGGDVLDVAAVNPFLIKATGSLRVLPAPTAAIHTAPIGCDRIIELIDQLQRMADVVLLDLPATFDDTYFRILERADRILLVGEQTIPSIHDMKLVRDTLRERGCMASMTTVVNKFDPKEPVLSKKRISEQLGVQDLYVVALDSKNYRRAQNEGASLHRGAPRCAALRDIRAIVDGLIGQPEPPAAASARRGWLANLFAL